MLLRRAGLLGHRFAGPAELHREVLELREAVLHHGTTKALARIGRLSNAHQLSSASRTTNLAWRLQRFGPVHYVPETRARDRRDAVRWRPWRRAPRSTTRS